MANGKAAEKAAKTEAAVKTEATAETAVETETTAKSAREKDSGTEELQLVYIGPPLIKYQLLTNQIITGTQEDIDEYTKDARAVYPAVKHLLVSVDDLAEKKRRVKTPGNMYNKFYADIASAASVEAETKEG